MRISTFGYAIILTPILFLCACAEEKKSGGGGGSAPVIPEASYCSTISTFTTSSTITGTAIYKRRAFYALGLGDVDTTDYPIRRAEVRVLSGSTVVQCGETDNSGNFSLSLPQNSNTYTIQVNSRAFNSYVKTSILNDPTNNVFYSLTTTVVPDSNKSVGTLTASATNSTLLGGAFNIYDQILKANEFLRDKTAGCGALCTTFTVATKSQVYWKPGFNPGTYVGTSSGLSFYSPSESKLYILGGLNGDPDNTDTDHFDNTVIIHEYGHFIEDQYSKTNSPGGSHTGTGVIDARLAWGEGWANFFGVYVNSYFTGDTRYRDTKGNKDGSVHSFFFNLELDSDTSDAPAALLGQGNFREFAVTQSLWDSVDKTADALNTSVAYNSNPNNDEAITANFYEFWSVLTVYFSTSSYYFRNFGLFMELQNALAGRTDVSTILTSFQQRANRIDYGYTVTAPNGTCNYTIQSSSPSTSFAGSDQYRDNDFYQYTHTGGALTLTLTHNGNSDLDLYLYTSNYQYGSTSSMAGSSNQSSGTTETITLSNLAAGTYMINVMNYSGTGSNTYTLSTGAGQLCH